MNPLLKAVAEVGAVVFTAICVAVAVLVVVALVKFIRGH